MFFGVAVLNGVSTAFKPLALMKAMICFSGVLMFVSNRLLRLLINFTFGLAVFNGGLPKGLRKFKTNNVLHSPIDIGLCNRNRL